MLSNWSYVQTGVSVQIGEWAPRVAAAALPIRGNRKQTGSGSGWPHQNSRPRSVICGSICGKWGSGCRVGTPEGQPATLNLAHRSQNAHSFSADRVFVACICPTTWFAAAYAQAPLLRETTGTDDVPGRHARKVGRRDTTAATWTAELGNTPQPRRDLRHRASCRGQNVDRCSTRIEVRGP